MNRLKFVTLLGFCLIQGFSLVAAPADDGVTAARQSLDTDGSEVFENKSHTRFALVGLADKCLDVLQGDTADGTPVILFDCHGGENQRWDLDLVSYPQRVVGIGGKCLVPDFNHPSGEIRAVIGQCVFGTSELWRLVGPNAPSSPSLLQHFETGLCLDVRREDTANRTPMLLFPCHGNPNQVWRPAPETCIASSYGLCLDQGRFQVDVEWRTPSGSRGRGRAVPAGTDDSGLLWFFQYDNWEMLIKVLDGCDINSHFWVFAAATTNVEYTLTVTDTATSSISEYFNPLGNLAAAITDTSAFATCPAGVSGEPAERAAPVVEATPVRSGIVDLDLKGSCVPSPTQMCLNDGRFMVEVDWRSPQGFSGSGRLAPVGSADSGLFWFFSANNWEMLIKVLDACHTADPRFLMLAAATTNVQYTLRVTDTDTGVFQEYFNPQGVSSPAIVDSFRTCP